VVFEKLRWSFPDEIRRVYDNSKARRELGWNPQYDFARAIGSLAAGQSPWSPLTTELNQAPT
jgi:nucleoside-diphosphate-sugar epimerase